MEEGGHPSIGIPQETHVQSTVPLRKEGPHVRTAEHGQIPNPSWRSRTWRTAPFRFCETRNS